MRSLRGIGLPLGIGLLLILSVGTGSASAGTTLCKFNETPCGFGNALTAESKVQFRTKTVLIAFTNGSTGCSEAVFTAKVTTPGSKLEKVKGTLEGWNFSGCNPCPVKVLKPGSFSVEWTPETMNGKFSISEFEFEVSCGLTQCVFMGSFEPAPTLKGGKPAVLEMKLNEVPLWKIGSGVCRLKSVWEANWEVTNYSELWVSNG